MYLILDLKVGEFDRNVKMKYWNIIVNEMNNKDMSRLKPDKKI